MADNALIFTRCIKCGEAVWTITEPTKRLVHLDDGNHVWQDWNSASEAPAPISSQDGLASIRRTPRPSHRTLEMWKDVRAGLNHIHQVQFYLGHLPEKPMHGYDDEVVRLQLEDARAVLGELALALSEGVEP